jgi:hypothetical protein
MHGMECNRSFHSRQLSVLIANFTSIHLQTADTEPGMQDLNASCTSDPYCDPSLWCNLEKRKK